MAKVKKKKKLTTFTQVEDLGTVMDTEGPVAAARGKEKSGVTTISAPGKASDLEDLDIDVIETEGESYGEGVLTLEVRYDAGDGDFIKVAERIISLARAHGVIVKAEILLEYP